MVYNPFRLKILFRIIILTLSIFLFFYFLMFQKYYLLSSVIFVFSLIQVYWLFKYFDHTNRELSKFFNSIRFSDFSQNFLTKDTDDSLKELKTSLINVMNQFREARNEREEQFQYLQTVMKHIGTGVISFKQNGEVEQINNAAKDMLNVPDLKNIHNLPSLEKEFIKNLMDPKSGGKELVKLTGDGKEVHLAMSAVDIKMHGEKYTIVSMQNITNELERERMANEFEIAHRVQTRLLPKNDPDIKGFEISAVCFPAKEVGGDYYDYIDLRNGKKGIVIGDVAGKGMPAAFYMTLTKGIFQASAAHDEDPKQVLITINDIICRSMVKGSFVTLIYAILDPEKRTVKFARAGHEPLIVFSKKENRIYEYKPSGMGVGLDCGNLFNESIEECEIKLDNEDVLIFYTDGLVDLRNKENQEFDYNRLKECIIKHSSLPAKEFTGTLIRDLRRYKGDAVQYDDLTMIAIKCCEPE